MQRPRIGLTTLYDPEKNPEKLQYYLQAIQLVGGEPVLLHPDTCRFDPHLLSSLGGLLLAGGGDVHPRRYQEEINGTNVASIHEGRDEMEFRLLAFALEQNIPVLAICRGFQVLNVAFGGKLVQHIPGHKAPKGEPPAHHPVHILPGTRLWDALGRREHLIVNSHHHQGVRQDHLAPGLRVSAVVEGEPPLVEGIESPRHRWVIGVQWHPERFHEFEREAQEAQKDLFRTFVRACVPATVRSVK